MSRIKYNDSNWLDIQGYKNTLQKKIERVCEQIRFDDSKITWIIYNPVAHITKYPDINRSGFCMPSKNEIWISTFSIDTAINYGVTKTQFKNKTEFLADVILDEITHFQTNCDHSDEKYEKKYLENMNIYYNSRIDSYI